MSYGGDWVAGRETRVATLGVGYADGVPRGVQGKAVVLVHGKRVPMVGRVTMDFIMVDLGADDSVSVGDVATLVGRDGTEEITIDEFADWDDTIAYEILARLGPRVERRHAGP